MTNQSFSKSKKLMDLDEEPMEAESTPLRGHFPLYMPGGSEHLRTLQIGVQLCIQVALHSSFCQIRRTLSFQRSSPPKELSNMSHTQTPFMYDIFDNIWVMFKLNEGLDVYVLTAVL